MKARGVSAVVGVSAEEEGRQGAEAATSDVTVGSHSAATEPGTDESLELLEERRAELLAEDEDEGELEELVGDLADSELLEREPTELGAIGEPEPLAPGRREFVCAGCHLVFSRSFLGDEARHLCRDCVGVLGIGPSGREVPARRRPREAVR